jgi:hypothetical protein
MAPSGPPISVHAAVGSCSTSTTRPKSARIGRSFRRGWIDLRSQSLAVPSSISCHRSTSMEPLCVHQRLPVQVADSLVPSGFQTRTVAHGAGFSVAASWIVLSIIVLPPKESGAKGAVRVIQPAEYCGSGSEGLSLDDQPRAVAPRCRAPHRPSTPPAGPPSIPRPHGVFGRSILQDSHLRQ